MSFVVRIVMRSSCCASLSEISKFMNMNSMLLVRIETLHRACDFGWRVDAVLTKGGNSSDIGVVWVKNADRMSFCIRDNVLIKKKERSQGGCDCDGQCFSYHY